MKMHEIPSPVTSLATGHEEGRDNLDTISIKIVSDSNDLNKSQNSTSTQIKRFSNPLDRFKAIHTRLHAIHAHCYQCVGAGTDSWWKTEIGNCQITECALWDFRPYKNRYKNE